MSTLNDNLVTAILTTANAGSAHTDTILHTNYLRRELIYVQRTQKLNDRQTRNIAAALRLSRDKGAGAR